MEFMPVCFFGNNTHTSFSEEWFFSSQLRQAFRSFAVKVFCKLKGLPLFQHVFAGDYINREKLA
jgi:hypothetical protein